jgi:hypothetical protein
VEVEQSKDRIKELEEEVDFLRQKLKDSEELKEINSAHVRNWFDAAIAVAKAGAREFTAEYLSELVLPIFSGVDLRGKTLFVRVPVDGLQEEEAMIRYSVYVDFLKEMGAKSVVFLPLKSEVEVRS